MAVIIYWGRCRAHVDAFLSSINPVDHEFYFGNAIVFLGPALLSFPILTVSASTHIWIPSIQNAHCLKVGRAGEAGNISYLSKIRTGI